MKMTALELDILKWISENQPSLAADIAQVNLVRRTPAAAFYSYFIADERRWDRLFIDGPTIWTGRDCQGGSILWLVDGRPACLEVYSFSEGFTEDLEGYELAGPDTA
jgi:hypothetical protein